VQAASTQPTLERLRSRGTIVLGHREAAIPFSYIVEGRPIGFSVDLCLEIVDGLRRRLNLPTLKVQWVKLQAAERLPAVQDGRVDLECGNTTVNAERRKSVAFTTPFFIAGAGVLVRSDLPAQTLTELSDRRVAVVPSTTGAKIVERANASLMRLETISVNDNAQAFAALESGRADAWITDDVLLAAYRAQAADPARYRMLDRRHTIEPLAVALRKDDPAFQSAVDAEVGALFTSGRVEALYTRWFMRPTPPRQVNLELPPSRLLREFFRFPLKLKTDVDVIIL
jgi:glutamate/aspartate transport system substrate-binding protein